MQMKKVIQYVVILLLTAGLDHVCEAQSKDETMQWIKMRLPYAAATSDDTDASVSYGDVVFSECVLTFTQKIKSVNKYVNPYEESTVYTITVPLGRLSYAKYTSADDRPDDALFKTSVVSLKSLDKIIAVKWTETMTIFASDRSVDPRGIAGKKISETTKNGSSNNSQFEIAASDSDLAQRMAKALSHANQLCGGGKKEAF